MRQRRASAVAATLGPVVCLVTSIGAVVASEDLRRSEQLDELAQGVMLELRADSVECPRQLETRLRVFHCGRLPKLSRRQTAETWLVIERVLIDRGQARTLPAGPRNDQRVERGYVIDGVFLNATIDRRQRIAWLAYMLPCLEVPPFPPPRRPREELSYPRRTAKVEPAYPQSQRLSRLQARVVLNAVVRADGTIGDVCVLRSSAGPPRGRRREYQERTADPAFEKEAIDAVRQWRYDPARIDGSPVDLYFTVVVDFELK